MIRLYLTKNILRFLCAALVLFMLVDIQQKSRAENELQNAYELYEYARAYVEDNSAALYDNAHNDAEKYFDKRVAIEYMQDRTDLDENDRLAIIMGKYKFSQSDMAWVNSQYNKPGEDYPTVYYDSVLLDMLIKEYSPRWNIASVTDNTIKLCRRNLRRYQPGEYDYKLSKISLAAAEQINAGYSDTAVSFGVTLYLPRFESDMFIALLILLMCFTMFSKLRENGYLKYAAASRQGINRFAVKQYAAGIILVTAAFIIYAAGHILYASMYLTDVDILSAPIQIINGYQDFVYPFSIGGYMLLSAGVKLLFLQLLYSLVCLISLISKNSIISFCISLLAGAAVWLLPNITDSGAIKGLCAGNMGALSSEQYINILGTPVFAPAVLITVYVLLIAVIFSAIALFGKKLCRNGI